MKRVDIMSHRIIGVHPVFIKLGIGPTGAIFLSQALYWSSRGRCEDSWFYKTMEEWERETYLTRDQIETARARLKKLGILEEKRQGMPAKLFYKVDLEALENLLSQLESSSDNSSATIPRTDTQISPDLDSNLSSNQECDFPSKQDRENPPVLYKEHRLHTEITTEITTNINISDETSMTKIPSSTTLAHEVFLHWQTIMRHPKAKADIKRLRLIKERLAEGYTVDDLKKAIEGCRKSPFHMGHNADGTIHDRIDLILRNASQVDKFIGINENPPIPKDRATLESEKGMIGYMASQIRKNSSSGDTFTQ